MNIFEIYLKKIQDLIVANSSSLKIKNNISFSGTLVETPPQEFNYDLSSNIALVLGKKTIYKKNNFERNICDFIAGMTDRYAINLYNSLK